MAYYVHGYDLLTACSDLPSFPRFANADTQKQHWSMSEHDDDDEGDDGR